MANYFGLSVPDVDWSQITRWPQMSAEADARAREQAYLRALQGGLPRGAGGGVDYGAAAQQAARYGALPQVSQFITAQQQAAQLGESTRHSRVTEEQQAAQLEQLKKYQTESLRLQGLQIEEKPQYQKYTNPETGQETMLEILPQGKGINIFDPQTGRWQTFGGSRTAPPPPTPVPTQPVPGAAGTGFQPQPVPQQPVPAPAPAPAPTPQPIPPQAPGAAPPGAGLLSPTPLALQGAVAPQQRPPSPYGPAPMGSDLPEYRKKVSEAAVKERVADLDKQKTGVTLLGMIDDMRKDIHDPNNPAIAGNFNKAAGVYSGAASTLDPISKFVPGTEQVARAIYEASVSPEAKDQLVRVQQTAQAIKSFLQRALLSGQGAVSENERAAIDRILGNIHQARSAKAALDQLDTVVKIISKGFNAQGGATGVRTQSITPSQMPSNLVPVTPYR